MEARTYYQLEQKAKEILADSKNDLKTLDFIEIDSFLNKSNIDNADVDNEEFHTKYPNLIFLIQISGFHEKIEQALKSKNDSEIDDALKSIPVDENVLIYLSKKIVIVEDTQVIAFVEHYRQKIFALDLEERDEQPEVKMTRTVGFAVEETSQTPHSEVGEVKTIPNIPAYTHSLADLLKDVGQKPETNQGYEEVDSTGANTGEAINPEKIEIKKETEEANEKRKQIEQETSLLNSLNHLLHQTQSELETLARNTSTQSPVQRIKSLAAEVSKSPIFSKFQSSKTESFSLEEVNKKLKIILTEKGSTHEKSKKAYELLKLAEQKNSDVTLKNNLQMLIKRFEKVLPEIKTEEKKMDSPQLK